MNGPKQHDAFAIAGQLAIKTFKDGELIRQSGPFRNKVVSSNGYGRNIILRQMAGDLTYAVEIDSASLGDGAAAPADGDTALGNSLVSGLTITNVSISNNVLTIDVFVPDGDLPDDTYAEFGLFSDSRLMSRVLITPAYTKAAGEDTLFTYTLTLTG